MTCSDTSFGVLTFFHPGEGGSSSSDGVFLEGFRAAAFMRREYLGDLPQGSKPGDPTKAGIVFVNLTGETQDMIIGVDRNSVPRYKSRVVEVTPRMTDIWVKGGKRMSYDLKVGVLYRFELNKYVDGERLVKELPVERVHEIGIRNISTERKTLFINGDADFPCEIGAGSRAEIKIPGGDVVLSYGYEDTPLSYYVIVRPQPGLIVEMG
ncbi:hypothetical protein J7K50_04695 [bacterium]|nr:hypothetical protein [bacterium]